MLKETGVFRLLLVHLGITTSRTYWHLERLPKNGPVPSLMICPCSSRDQRRIKKGRRTSKDDNGSETEYEDEEGIPAGYNDVL